jgi:predicted secreted protein
MPAPKVYPMREFTDPERVEVEAGEPFVIVLTHNFEGPYLWTVADVPPEIRVEREDNRPPHHNGQHPAPGASGEKVFQLEATEPGTFPLRFERRFQSNVDRERSVVVNAY